MSPEEPDFEISEASISGAHQRDDIFNRRARWRGLRITAQISVLVVLALVASIVVVRAPLQAFLSAQQGPTPIPTRPPSLPQVIIRTDVSSETLTVNGKPVPFNSNANNQAVTLTKQHSIIMLSASPFRPISCTVDTTELGHSQNGGNCNANGTDNGIPALDMNFTLADLPTLPRQQFNTYLTQKLAQLSAIQAQVPAKEHYAIGSDTQFMPTIALAATPLHAQVQVSSSTPNFLDPECIDAICPGNVFTHSTFNAPSSVDFILQLHIGWQFFDSAGNQVADYFPTSNNLITGPSPAILSDSPFALQLQYNAKTGWSDSDDTSGQSGQFSDFNPAFQLANDYCDTGSSIVNYLIHQQNLNSDGNGISSFGGLTFFTGCLLAITTTNTQQTPTDPNADPFKDTNNAWFLVHFGAVLAVNANAHTLLPQLPLANAQEVTDVRQAPQG